MLKPHQHHRGCPTAPLPWGTKAQQCSHAKPHLPCSSLAQAWSPNLQRVGWHLPAQPAGTRVGDWGWRGLQPRTRCTSPASHMAPLLPQTIRQRVKPRKQHTNKNSSQPKEQTHRFPPFLANLEELIWQDLFATLGMQTEEGSWSLTFLRPPTIADRSQSSEQVRAPRGFPLTIISASRGEGAAQHSPQCWRPARLLGATTLELARSLLHGGSPGSRGQDFPIRRRQHEASRWWWWSRAEPKPLPAAPYLGTWPSSARGPAPPAATHPSPSMGAASIPEHAQYGLIFSHYRALMTCKQKEVSLAKGEEIKKVQDPP